MKRQNLQGLATYQFETPTFRRVRYAVYTRLGGVSLGHLASLNVGHSVGDEPARVEENHARIYAHLGLQPGQVVSGEQVHGPRLLAVGCEDGGKTLPATDALITDNADVALMLRFADCQPILLYDPRRRALGLVHAGWRGTAMGLPRRVVEAMRAAYGCRPSDLVAGLGPCIGPCCYQVGDDVVSAMGYALPNWAEVVVRTERGWWLDLSGANAQLLRQAGVGQIERPRLCTACRVDEFYSHRAESGRTGRFAVVALLTPKDTASRPAIELGVDRTPERTSPDPAEPTSLHPPGFPAFGERSG
jgi:YfiH family protein